VTRLDTATLHSVQQTNKQTNKTNKQTNKHTKHPTPTIIIGVRTSVHVLQIGCEEEQELVTRFNLKKRSKKHLRKDVRRNAERVAREEEERAKREEEEAWKRRRTEQLAREKRERGDDGDDDDDDDDDDDSSSEEEEGIIGGEGAHEYLVYICECCRKKFWTKNQFVNHIDSRKHKEKVAAYEKAGLIVTSVQLRGGGGDDHIDNGKSDDDIDSEAEYFGSVEWDILESDNDDTNQQKDEIEEEKEEHQPTPTPKHNLFAAFADDSSSSSSDDDESSQDETQKPPSAPTSLPRPPNEQEQGESEDSGVKLDEELEELIYQNEIERTKINATTAGAEEDISPSPSPLPFDDEAYDPENYTVEENRLLSVHHRLRKRLAAKGLAPSHQIEPADAVAMGKTLLQQVMEANMDTLQQRLEAYNAHKAECRLLNRANAFAGGNSKALAGQYTFRQDAADDTKARANVHHTGRWVWMRFPGSVDRPVCMYVCARLRSHTHARLLPPNP